MDSRSSTDFHIFLFVDNIQSCILWPIFFLILKWFIIFGISGTFLFRFIKVPHSVSKVLYSFTLLVVVLFAYCLEDFAEIMFIFFLMKNNLKTYI